MRKAPVLAASLAALASFAAASHGGEGMHSSELWLLAFTLVVLGALAIYIYLRVQEAGILTFLPQTAMEDD